jgi:hypothetical protein
VVKNTKRFRLGIALAIPGYLLLFTQSLRWLKTNSLLNGLLSLLGVAMVASVGM